MDKRDILLNSSITIASLIIGVVLIGVASSWLLITIGIGACFIACYHAVTYYFTISKNIGFKPFWSRWLQKFPWILDVLAISVFISITIWLLSSCVKGHMPFSWDHPIHLLRFWDFIQILEKGQLSGWSDSWNQGYPLGEAYPPGLNWWCGLFYIITFGQLSLESTYALAFLVFYVLVGASAYHLGKTFFNRAVGFMAGLVSLFDAGGWRQGGYDYIVNVGVWSQSLGTVFSLIAFSYLYRVLTRRRHLDLILCSLALGASVLCHPMCLVYYGICVPIFFLTVFVGDTRKRVNLLPLLALALGIMLSCFWLIPFVVKSGWFTNDGGLKWLSLKQISKDILNGKLFDRTLPFLTWFGVLGGILAFRRRHLRGVFLACAAGALLVFSAKDVFYSLDYPGILSSFNNLIYERVCVLVKPFFFILASYAVYTIFETKSFESFNKRHLVVVSTLMIIVLAPLTKPMISTLQDRNKLQGKKLLGRVITKYDISYWNDFKKYADWLKAEKSKTNDFFRVAYEDKKANHFFACAPIYTGIPAVKKGTSPAPPFQGRPAFKEPENQPWLSVRYVVKLSKLRRKNLKLVQTFGKIHVYSNKKYSPQLYSIKGPGKVKIENYGLEYIKLSVAETSAESRIVIHRANFENWRAKLNGKTIPISNYLLEDEVNAISVAAGDGIIEVWYDWPWCNVIGSILSWSALATLALIGAALFIRRPNSYTFVGKLRKLVERMTARLAPGRVLSEILCKRL